MNCNIRIEKHPKNAICVSIIYTVAVLFAAILLCEILYQFRVGVQSLSVVMILAIFIVAAITNGYWYGLGASIFGMFAYDYLITNPRLGFSFTLGFPITLSIMLLVSLTTSTVITNIKKRATVAKEKERQAELLYTINRKLLSKRTEEGIAQSAMQYLRDRLQRSIALHTQFDHPERGEFYFFKAAEDVDKSFFARTEERKAAFLAARQKEMLGAGAGKLPGDAYGYYCPIVANGEVYGVFGISCQKGAIEEIDIPFIELIIEQTAHALRIQALTKQQQQALVMAESEKTRNSFLRSISHDLRTPLTSIIGSSATFLDNFKDLSAPTQLHLVEGIQTDAQWLMSMAENILSVTRINQNNMEIAKTEEAAEEVVAEAVSLFRKRYPMIHITICRPDRFLLVPMDALLITQVINNLLDNAQRHAQGTEIVIRIMERSGFAEFSVSDRGPGIAEDARASLFEMQPIQSGKREDSSRGLGIGLSICKKIIESHGGWIVGENIPNGGARFTFGLPMSEEQENGE